jgi:hypothetical protein
VAERKITVQFDGQDVGLDATAKKAATSLDGVETSATHAGDGVEKAGSKMATLGLVGVGTLATIVGVSDGFDGWGKIMSGDVAGGLTQMVDGVAAVGAGLSALVMALPEKVTAWVVGHATMAASALASFASQIAEWIVLAATSLASAASVAAAWLLSVAPIALVIIAVVALVVLIVKNWDTIKSVIAAGWHFVEAVSLAVWNGIKAVVVGVITSMVNIVQAQIDMVKSIFRTLVSAIGSIMSGLADTITAPFRNAFGAIKTLWNNSIGGKGFSVPSWIPVIGGKSFTIPYLAQGGIVTQPTLAMIGEAGPEAVVPLDRGGLGGRTVIELRSSGSAIDDMLLELLRKAIRNGGGGTVSVLG